MNGDGKADSIGITAKGLTGENGTINIRVLLSTGKILSTTGSTVHWAENPFIGAAPVDGVKGAEILVGDQEGAHYQQFRVVTYRAGALVTEKPPPKAGISNRASRWGIDSSYSSNIGLYRSTSGTNYVMTVKTAVNDTGSRYWTGKTIVYYWRSSGWIQHSAKSVRYTASQTAFIGGLWIQGLPPYGGYDYPMSFSNCTDLHSFYPHGVGKSGAVDKSTSTKVTNFYRDNGLYAANDGPRAGAQYDLDPDNDGIACEKR